MTVEGRLRTAHHEAAHAVLAHVAGHRVVLVAVADGLRLHGLTEVAWRGDWHQTAVAVDNMTATLAGPMAEYLAGPATGWHEPVVDTEAAVAEARAALGADADELVTGALADPEAIDDEAHARRLAEIAFGPEAPLFLMALRARAARVVDEHACVIRALAAELMRTPILDGRAVAAIIEAALVARKET